LEVMTIPIRIYSESFYDYNKKKGGRNNKS